MSISPWVRDLFAAIDRKDARAFAAFLAEDAVFRFGSHPQVRGRDGARAAVEAFFATIAGVRHELTREWKDADSSVVEGEVTYTRHDGSTVTLPFADVLDRHDGAIRAYKIYVDVAPLFAPSSQG
jgi:ketosteroid isomerase-like protein